MNACPEVSIVRNLDDPAQTTISVVAGGPGVVVWIRATGVQPRMIPLHPAQARAIVAAIVSALLGRDDPGDVACESDEKGGGK